MAASIGVRLVHLGPVYGEPKALRVTYRNWNSSPELFNMFKKIGPIERVDEVHMVSEAEDLHTATIVYENIKDTEKAIRKFYPMLLGMQEDTRDGRFYHTNDYDYEEDSEDDETESEEDQLEPEPLYEDDVGRRLHFLIPKIRGQYIRNGQVFVDLSDYGSIDYIKIWNDRNGHGRMGVVKFFNEEDATRFFESTNRYRPRMCPPRRIGRRHQDQPTYVKCPSCDRDVTRYEVQNHTSICRYQRGVYITHWFCGETIRRTHWEEHVSHCQARYHWFCNCFIHIEDWDQHLSECNGRYEYVTPTRTNLYKLLHFLQSSGADPADLISFNEIHASALEDLQGLDFPAYFANMQLVRR